MLRDVPDKSTRYSQATVERTYDSFQVRQTGEREKYHVYWHFSYKDGPSLARLDFGSDA